MEPRIQDTLTLERMTFTNLSTVGEIYLNEDKLAYTLEPSCRKIEGQPIAIPAGKYEITLYESPHFKMEVPLLVGVPGREAIEIHPGNGPADTHGCILPGLRFDVDTVYDSRLAFTKLLAEIRTMLGKGKVYIAVLGGSV